MPNRVKETIELTDLHEEGESQRISNLEVEELLFENTSEKPRRFWNFPLIAGYGLLGAVILFLFQQIGILPGNSIQDYFILFPLIGILLVILYGLSPRLRRRNKRAIRGARKAERKKRKHKAREKIHSISTNLEKPKWNFPPKSSKKYLAGVCGGLAQYINMNETLFRVLYIIAIMATGVAIPLIAYILLAIFMPSPENEPDIYS